MENKLLKELKIGKKIKVKHREYEFTINATIKLQDNEPLVTIEKISLPQKANRGEKLLLKLVQIYCYDVLTGNLIKDVLESEEYNKWMNRTKKKPCI
jgi:hypothetical protein